MARVEMTMALYPKMVFLGKGGYDLRNGTHGRKDHDVHCRVGIDPEKVLVKQGIAPFGRIEESNAQDSFPGYHQQGDSHNGCGQQLDPACSIEGPGKQGHLQPGHPRCPHPVDGDNEIQTGQDGRESQHKGTQGCRQHVGPCFKTVGGIEGPSGIGRSVSKQGDDHQDRRQVHRCTRKRGSAWERPHPWPRSGWAA